MNRQDNMKEFVVLGAPEVCLGLVRQYFESEEWPYSGLGDRSSVRKSDFDNNMLTATVSKKGSYLGCLMVGVLSIITFGLFFIVWIVWTELTNYPEVHVNVRADPIGPTQTRLTVTSSNPDDAAFVGEWIQRELVKRKVARTHTSRKTTQPSLDIPAQIKKLAELRDSGAITEEEFQKKKEHLLKRM